MIILLDVDGQKCRSHMGVCTETIVIFAFAFSVVAFTSSSWFHNLKSVLKALDGEIYFDLQSAYFWTRFMELSHL